MLCQTASDICLEDQTALDSVEGATIPRPRLKGKQKEGIDVLGVVTFKLHDIGRLERELRLGCMCVFRGAMHFFFTHRFLSHVGTTDTVSLGKPQCYDLVIDMTSFSPERAFRPGLQLSRRDPNGRSRRPSLPSASRGAIWCVPNSNR